MIGRPKLDIKVNDKFESLTVIGDAFKKPPCKFYFVQCRCACGNVQEYRQSDLHRGKSTQCRKCSDRDRRKVKVGDKYSDWTVIGESHDDRGWIRWVCQCKCGTVGQLETGALRGDRHNKCRICAGIESRTGIDGTLWGRIYSGAVQRNIPVEVDWDYCKALLERQQHKCALTGQDISLPKFTQELLGGVGTASLDRIDSDLGYVVGNLQWTARKINILKLDWSQEEFISMCCAVADHQRNQDPPEPEPDYLPVCTQPISHPAKPTGTGFTALTRLK